MSSLENWLARVVAWARERPDVIAVTLVGSHAKGLAREGSDVDLVVVVERVEALLAEDDWLSAFGVVQSIRDEDYGLVHSRRVQYEGGPEAEWGLADRRWTSTNPLDEGTARVIRAGMRVLYDPHAVVEKLEHAVKTLRPSAESIATDRLFLRRPTWDDLPVCFEIHGDPATSRFRRDGPDRTIEQSTATLAKWLSHWKLYGFGPWTVGKRDDADAPAIGFGGLRWRAADELPGLNLYFRFRPAAWGHGYATELARASAQFAFGRVGASELTAIINPDNTPSIRVVERIGMRLLGEVDYRGSPSLLYALKAPER
jgi:RimJ/RimL family protein N-acetyltransferase/predicted nucleotidyltransferase